MKKAFPIAALVLSLSTFLPHSAQAALPFSVDGQQLPSLAPMLERATPAVVSVNVAGTQVTTQRIPEMFRYFFGPQAPQQRVQERPFKGLGSGVIIDADKGHIITNHHVINGADKISVGLSDGREFEAELIGSDPESDIALLKIDAKNLTAIKKANSDQLRVGDFSVAIGNPFGLGQTVTSGIVSALGRSGLGIERLENFIQTDAAINSGNSGGALVNLKGELIGINTAIVGPNGGNVGIGFAIPSNMAFNLVEQIIDHGEVRRGVLGVIGNELDKELAQQFDYDTVHGAFITQVVKDSAAAKAGLKPGDIITHLNDRPVKSFQSLRAKIGTLGAGKEVNLTVLREGEELKFEVLLGSGNEQNVQAAVIHPGLEGASLSDTNAAVGVEISEVTNGSPAYRNGLQKGDIIVQVDRRKTTNLKDLRSLLSDKEHRVALLINRNGQLLYTFLRK
ncbi:DegQ family serine endoprotease [Paraferrimonas sp. SM1919]|uniref:DegQ family serine endoprotease n=1 Tax=Paraferrimonas sp. SM1919 TaxID=2662263 RepID=UPI0013D55F40|nr:DegQ family serine endoprotease [Paraferrimonas sp. SM1919]